MASRSNHGSPTRADLFSGLKFWLSHQVPMKPYYKECLLKRGGTIVALESLADIFIVDDARKVLPTGEGYYSYKFIDEAIKNNNLEILEDHIVNTRAAADRQVGSVTVAAMGKRNPFTKEDDQILFNWAEPVRRDNGFWKGNEIYKQLAREYPRHTFQSWRTRYINMVEKGVKMTITEKMGPAAQADENNLEAVLGRSPKRRRLNGTHSASAGDQNVASARQSLSPQPETRPESRSSSRLKQTPKQARATHERDGPANAVNGSEMVPDRSTKQLIETKSNESERQPSSHRSIELDDVQSQSVREAGTIQWKQAGIQIADLPTSHVSDNIQPASGLKQSSNGSSGGRLAPQSSSGGDSDHAVPKLPVFTKEEIQTLYRSVPHIYHTQPEHVEEGWARTAEEYGTHTAAEWRAFYERAILPEYKRRNNLETESDLGEHLHGLLAEEQLSQTLQGQEVEDGHAESEESSSEGEGYDMFFKEGPRSAHVASPVDEDAPREASPELGLQMILQAIEVRENGIIIAKDTHLAHTNPTAPSGTQSPMIIPKKKLFGRTLKSTATGSQMHEKPNGINPTAQESFGTTSTASNFRPSNNHSTTSSKRPPESGQRPPKSLTTSQEESALSNTGDKQINGSVSIADMLAATDRVLEDDDDENDIVPEAPQAEGPILNLLDDSMVEPEGVPFSPLPSDTGSEYMPFDTGPERSQLWDPSQGEMTDETDSDQETENIERDESRTDQRASKKVPKKQPRTDSATPKRLADTHHKDLDEDSEVTDETDDEGSPDLGAPAFATTKAGPRIETQALFQQPLSVDEEDLTGLEVPPPDGGWDQFGVLEENLDEEVIQGIHDIRKSVEGPDHAIMDENSSVASGTDEEVAELLDKQGSLEIPHSTEIVVIPDDASERTTSSVEPTTPQAASRTQKHQLWRSSSSSPLRKNLNARAASFPDTSLERDDDAESTASDDHASDDQASIESWYANQPTVYSTVNRQIVHRLASTSLQATIMNLSAASYTMRDMITNFECSEVNRKTRFERISRIKHEHTDGTSPPDFEPTTKLTENEAKSLLPQDILGVWTMSDDKDFLSQTLEGLKRVEKKHGAKGVKRRAKFLRARYGQEVPDGLGRSTPGSRYMPGTATGKRKR